MGDVAGTRVGKRDVGSYLMPVYATPGLADSPSPELRKRRQGKSCFNFTKVDESFLTELDALTARASPGFREVAEAAPAPRR